MYDRRSRLAAHAQQGVLVPQQAQLADEALVFLHGALLLRGEPCCLRAQPLRLGFQTLHLRRQLWYGVSTTRSVGCDTRYVPLSHGHWSQCCHQACA